MDLEKAYNKIGNLCCVNHMAVTLSNMSIDKGVIPDKIDFFNGYNETHDDSFCKDTKDMVEALETIEEVVNLQKEIGCPLEVVIEALTYGIYIKNIYGEMVNFKVMLVYKNEQMGYYFRFINDGYVLLTDYKKTWWLKEDKSE